MIHHSKALDFISQILNISMIRHPHVEFYHLIPQSIKHVEIKKVSDKLTYDTSFESS